MISPYVIQRHSGLRRHRCRYVDIINNRSIIDSFGNDLQPYRIFSTSSSAENEYKHSNHLELTDNIPSIEEITRKLLFPIHDNHAKNEITVQTILNNSITIMESQNIPEATLSACHLLSSALEIPWEQNGFSTLLQLTLNTGGDNNKTKNGLGGIHNQILTHDQLITYASMIRRRMLREPIQYILGKWDFGDITLAVRSPCLCPRPETEELVQLVCEDIRHLLLKRKALAELLVNNGKGGNNRSDRRETNVGKIRILDVGCGTGAIGLSIAKEFQNDVTVVALDVNPEAVKLSKENALHILGKEEALHYQVFQCSALDYTKGYTLKHEGFTINHDNMGFDIVVSNPPYIPSQDMITLDKEVVAYEDEGALCGGIDGMDVIRDIVNRLPEWTSVISKHRNNVCHDGDNFSTCWMEVDTSHPTLMKHWLKGTSKNVQFVQSRNDMFGSPRFVQLNVSRQ